MAKTVQQAEAELRQAALAAVMAEDAYSKACEAEPHFFDYDADGKRTFSHENATPEWRLLVSLSNESDRALKKAARALADAIMAEQRACGTEFNSFGHVCGRAQGHVGPHMVLP